MPPGRHGRHRSRVLTRAVRTRVLALGILIAATCTVGVVSVVGASAATLGGVKTADVAAATGTVAIHSSGITATWTAKASSAAGFTVNNVTFTAPGADRFEVGEQLRISLIGATGASLCEITETITSQISSETIGRAGLASACGTNALLYSSIDRVAITAVR
ncbi:MAG: hypothetical protein JWN80_1856 [Microbacteriaceae bacterium]|jgi:hypothetical protein|nr:hypothetical protein [Microbacteriaceae bacterium]